MTKLLAVVVTTCALGCEPLDIVIGSNLASGAADGTGGSGAEGANGSGGGPGGCGTGQPGVWVDVSPPVSLALTINGAANYGFHSVAVDPIDAGTVYVGVDRQGLWKSTDCGGNWQKLNTGQNADLIDLGAPWALAIDPIDPAVMYISSGEGALGLFKSENGGVDWQQLFGPGNVTEPVNLGGQSAPDLYSVAIDPNDSDHLLVGFRWGWLAQDGSGDWLASGPAESFDGGQTWELIAPAPTMASNHNVFFLDDSQSWLVLSELSDGAYRTVDGGQSWQKVNDSTMRTGGAQLYRADDGTYYHTGGFGIFRSADGGASWLNVIEGRGPSTQGIAGDGDLIYASDGAAVQDPLYGAPFKPFLSAPESQGDIGWAVTGSQLFDNGANHLAADRTNHVIYASSWRVGLLRMSTQ